MTVSPCTPGGSTSQAQPCTPVGARSAAEVRPTLHLYMCNIAALDLAPPSVQHTLHPRWFNNENPYLLTKPVMHYVQDGRHPLPDFTTTPVTQTSHVRNQQTARAELGWAS